MKTLLIYNVRSMIQEIFPESRKTNVVKYFNRRMLQEYYGGIKFWLRQGTDEVYFCAGTFDTLDLHLPTVGNDEMLDYRESEACSAKLP
jgi:hypothetical protein